MTLRSIAATIALVAASLAGIATTAPTSAANATPTNGKIAYAALDPETGWEIRTINADGSGETTIVPALSGSGAPRGLDWSPDGSRLAFANGDTPEIVIVNADGTGRIELAYGTNALVHPSEVAWSPDGSRIAVPVWPDIGPPSMPSLIIVPVDGSAPVVVEEAPDNPLCSRDSGYHQLAWSPDGSALAFTYGFFCTSVATVRSDGTNLTTIAVRKVGPNSGSMPSSPTWIGPTRLAFLERSGTQGDSSSDRQTIIGIDADGSDEAPIIAMPAPDQSFPHLRASPDMSKLAIDNSGFADLGSIPLSVLGVDGTNLHEIAQVDRVDPLIECSDWSPDSEFLAWSDADPSDFANIQLNIRRADVSSPAVTLVTGLVLCPKWAPAPGHARDHVTLDISGRRNYQAAADLSSGDLEVTRGPAGNVTAVHGKGSFPGAHGGTATIAVHARRIWPLKLHAGYVTIADPGAKVWITYPVLTWIKATPTGATFTETWCTRNQGKTRRYNSTITIDDIT